MIKLSAAGYQGAGSVHSRGLATLASELNALCPGAFDIAIENDITAGGRPARDLLTLVESGALQVCYMASGYLTARVPDLAVIDLPYAVSERVQAYSALDKRAGQLLADRISAATKFRVLGFWDNGFRHVTNRARPIRTVEDCNGLVIRTLDNRIYQETLAAFGFVPKVTDVRDLVRAIATGEVDAQENPLTNAVVFKIYEHHPYVSMTGHLFGAALLLCNMDWFNALPKDAAAALESASTRATAAQRSFATREDTTALAALREHGVNVLCAEEIDLATFRQAVSGLRGREAARVDPAILAAYSGA
jgi:TRAP-type C4-dicarboxylate transport system substrate-binding protein